jgi:hypothetical protein
VEEGGGCVGDVFGFRVSGVVGVVEGGGDAGCRR